MEPMGGAALVGLSATERPRASWPASSPCGSAVTACCCSIRRLPSPRGAAPARRWAGPAVLSCTQGWPIDSAEWVAAAIPDTQPATDGLPRRRFREADPRDRRALRAGSRRPRPRSSPTTRRWRAPWGLRADDHDPWGRFRLSHSARLLERGPARPCAGGAIVVVPDEEGPLAPLRARPPTRRPPCFRARRRTSQAAPRSCRSRLRGQRPCAFVISASAPLPPDCRRAVPRPLRPPRARLLRRQRMRRDLLRPRGHGRRAGHGQLASPSRV